MSSEKAREALRKEEEYLLDVQKAVQKQIALLKVLSNLKRMGSLITNARYERVLISTFFPHVTSGGGSCAPETDTAPPRSINNRITWYYSWCGADTIIIRRKRHRLRVEHTSRFKLSCRHGCK